MKQHVKKSLVSAALAGVLLFSTAQGAAQYQPVDPANPYLPPVSGIFHGQEIHEENGTYSVYIPSKFQPCSGGVLLLTPNGTDTQAFWESETGRGWKAVADREQIALVAAGPLDGGEWNTEQSPEGRDDAAFLKKVYDTVRNKSGEITAAFDLDERAFYIVGYGEGGTVAQEFAMQWPAIVCGAAAVGGEAVPEAVAEAVGGQYSYPFAQADSLEGREELKVPNREVPVPMWLVGVDGSSRAAGYWVAASSAEEGSPNRYAQQVFSNRAARVWVTEADATAGVSPEVLYGEFLSKVQRFVGRPNGRLEWTVEHTNNGKSGFFTTEQMVGGKLRRWMTYVPSTYQAGTEVQLVVAIHGYSSAMTAFTGDSRWQDVAEKNGFIVAFAQGYPTDDIFGNIPVPYWNNELQGIPVSDVTDDVAYFREMVRKTKADYSIDDSRVYATGHSNGSCMTWLLAMEAADLFAAVAPVGSNMGAFQEQVPSEGEPVPVWNMKGQYDTDGAAKLEPGSTDAKTIDYWTAFNGVAGLPKTFSDPSGIFATREYRNSQGVPLVRFTEVKNSPHAYTPEEAEIIWEDFFSHFTLDQDGTRSYDGTPVKRDAAVTQPVFTDMDGHWAEQAVEAAAANGWVSGTSDSTFEPNAPVSRAMLTSILYRVEGEPQAEAAGFPDVPAGSYYSKAVGWAAANKIISGYEDGTFAPDDSVTREQLAVILCRYAQFKGRDVSAKADLSRFGDAAQIRTFARSAVEWANAEGLLTGVSDAAIAPQKAAARAEVAAILVRFLQ
ncbi:hypothetical protein D3Z52_11855 [Clostridiaceae bacterium]|nr:hypothetical protein [Clostridiaceae bacterium]